MRGRVLIVDDDRTLGTTIVADLRSREFSASWCASPTEALAMLDAEELDVVLTDLNMPHMDGIELCDRIVSNYQHIPVVVLTAFGSMDSAVEAIRAGAYDFVTKPIEMEVLALALDRAVQHRSLQERIGRLSDEVRLVHRFDELIGESDPMYRLYDKIERVADTDSAVLISGQSGTGKELVARALHERSRRRNGPFVAVNCPAIPETLLESELFGHTRGAFTDARTDRKGAFVQAERGTLFLDEIGELPVALHAKLLRALEQRCVRPLGSEREVKCDIRIVAATNRDLQAAVDEGRFREDLFFRINVVSITVPPLRMRGSDILLLAQHFLEQFASRCHKPRIGLSNPVAKKLLAYGWPGNVRELRNAIEHAVALAQLEELVVDDLPERIQNYRSSHVLVESNSPDALAPMEEVERKYILHVLDAAGGNRTLAAKILGFDRKTLYRKIERYAPPGGNGN